MNRMLGDRVIKIGDVTYVARPDFEALMRIEEGDTSLQEILGRFVGQRPKITDTVKIIHSCITSGEYPKPVPTLNDLGNAMKKVGFTNFIVDAVSLASEMFAADKEEKKTEKTSPEATPK